MQDTLVNPLKRFSDESVQGAEDDPLLRVLLVVNTLPPHDLSGVGEQVVQLARGLRSQGVEVEILGRGLEGARGPKLLFPLAIVVPVLQRLRKGNFDVVQVHESDGGLVALFLRIFRLPLLRLLVPPVQLVALLQVSYDEEARHVSPVEDRHLGIVAVPVPSEVRFRRYRTPVQRLLGRFTARCADTVLVPSEKTGSEISRDYGGPSPKVLPNTTAEQSSRPAANPTKGGRLLYVGRLRIRKGIEVLLWALAKLREEGYTFHLSIAGDGERREVLEGLVERLDLGERVSFLGRCHRDQLDVMLSESVALVVPSTYEGMPLVILEAMEAGVPVIASAVSGIPEVVVTGTTGWLVEPRNAEQLSGALAEALLDQHECARRGRAGNKRLAMYRPEVVARMWIRAVTEKNG